MTTAASIGMEAVFWGKPDRGTRFCENRASIVIVETQRKFSVRNWILEGGSSPRKTDVDGARDVTVLGATVAKTASFPFGSAIGERLNQRHQLHGHRHSRGRRVAGRQPRIISPSCP